MAKQTKSNVPPAPVWNLKVEFGDIKRNSTGFDVPIEVRVTQNGNAVPLAEVILKRGINNLASKITNPSGIAMYTFNPPLSDAGKSINLRVLLKNRIEEENINISLPSEEKGSSKDPEHLDVMGRVDNKTGDAVIRVTVTDEKGYGLANRVVTLFYNLEEHPVKTNPQGSKLHKLKVPLEPGEEIKVIADVSGIRKKSKITLIREKALDPKASRNNRISLCLLLASLVLWIICFKIGFGDPLISKPEIESSNWERYFWLGTFFWTIISVLYVPVAFREEWAQAWKNAKHKIDDPMSDSVGDPFIESTIDEIKDLSSSSKGKISSTNINQTSRQGATGRYGLGTLFSIDLLAEFVMELLPKMFVKIFKPN